MVKICDSIYANETETYKDNFDMFPYELSDFQKYAIEGIVNQQHVLITAHTGSGKTLPAEFAIQHFVKQGKKVIYTSPIKALSNQKFYDFQNKYPDITFGLFTGDIKTNPEADVCIMTTEILMNRLFNNDSQSSNVNDFQMDLNNELACVVFDEVHYINDAHRGQNWEKTILMLPKHVQMVMLSATIDQPQEFAKWCETNGSKEVYLCSTNHRVVPLGHYGFLTTNEGLYKGMTDEDKKREIRNEMNKLILLQDYKGSYNSSGYQTIVKHKKLMEDKKVFVKRQHTLNKLMEFLRNKHMLPCICFVFSRKQVEQCAREITIPLLEDDSKVPYTVKKECDAIIRKMPNHEEYMKTDEYIELVSLLEKGIGIHHSGMLPILREIVEMMISKKYIKVLFATESFAIGLDCPIKTAIFSGLTKYDGSQRRYLMAHEYTQMAGRAGRRGIDNIGYVVHCNNLFPLPTERDYRQMMSGIPQKLVSKYKIDYGLILNLLCTGITSDFHLFSENAMIYKDINKHIEVLKDKENKQCEKMENYKTQLTFLKTPLEECEKYIQKNNEIPMLKNKKRKQCEREIQQMKDQYRNIDMDMKKVREYQTMETEYVNIQNSLESSKQYIVYQSTQVLELMKHKNYVSNNEDNGYELTELGKHASYVKEIQPLITAHILNELNNFEEYGTKDIIQILSIFCDVKVEDTIKNNYPVSNGKCENVMKMIHNLFEEYGSLEDKYQVFTGIHTNNLNYDIYEYIEQWVNATTEVDCRLIVKKIKEEKDISLGDFSKALLKISTICKELYSMAIELQHIQFAHKLSLVDGLILKYVVTNQSLYV